MSASRGPHWQVRPVRETDLDALFDLAASLGPGMTTFPADRDTIAEKLGASVNAFAGRPDANAQYLLVMEDRLANRILGVAGIYPSIGCPHGFFSYRKLRSVGYSQALSISSTTEALHLSHDYSGMTEVGTLAVHKSARGRGAGRILARSRYMLMAVAPHLFADNVIAEMRGWQDARGLNPFWEAVGKKFFSMDFAQADRLSATLGVGFIANLLPRHPIYLDLLPQSAREAVGRPHDLSLQAYRMLLDEGFRFEGMVDVFDAGPQVVARRDEIRTIKAARRCEGMIYSRSDCGQLLVATNSLDDFKVVQLELSDQAGMEQEEKLHERLTGNQGAQLVARLVDL